MRTNEGANQVVLLFPLTALPSAASITPSPHLPFLLSSSSIFSLLSGWNLSCTSPSPLLLHTPASMFTFPLSKCGQLKVLELGAAFSLKVPPPVCVCVSETLANVPPSGFLPLWRENAWVHTPHVYLCQAGQDAEGEGKKRREAGICSAGTEEWHERRRVRWGGDTRGLLAP